MAVGYTSVRLVFFLYILQSTLHLTVVAHPTVKWDTSGISIFFFPRGAEPPDIMAGVPQPSDWGSPLANWPASACDPFRFFKAHSIIFDTTLW
jgi:hypothetical protein